MITDEVILLCNQILVYVNDIGSKDIEVLRLYKEGISVKEIALKLGVSENYPYKIIQKYKCKGSL